MKMFAIACVAVAAFAAPALAEQPSLTPGNNWAFKPTLPTIGNVIGQSDAQIIQNGQSVGGNHGLAGTVFDPNGCYNCDQTTYPGSRADLVQGALAQPGQPHNK